jgi:hypothetical protein
VSIATGSPPSTGDPPDLAAAVVDQAPAVAAPVGRLDLAVELAHHAPVAVADRHDFERRLDLRRVAGVGHVGELRHRKLDVRERRRLDRRVVVRRDREPDEVRRLQGDAEAAPGVAQHAVLARDREVHEVPLALEPHAPRVVTAETICRVGPSCTSRYCSETMPSPWTITSA